VILEGVVVPGVGRGRRFLEMAEYRDGIRRILSFNPHPGTLNLRLTPDSVTKMKALRREKRGRIQGFRRGEKSYGEVLTLPARIWGRAAGILLPSKSAHPEEILEVVAPSSLRETLGLRDGDRVTVEILLEGE
jgi:riboflavin kinase